MTPRPGSSRRRLLAQASTVLLTGLLATTASGGLASAGGQVPTQGADVVGRDPVAAIDAVNVHITSISPQVITNQDSVTISGWVFNDSDESLEGEINLRVAENPFSSRDELEAWRHIGIDDLADFAYIVQADPLSGRPFDRLTFKRFMFEVPISELELGTRDGEPGWGPRGIVVDFTTARQTMAADRSYVIYAPPSAIRSHLQVTVAAPMVAAPGETPEQGAARAARIIGQTTNHAVDWIVDPALLATPVDQYVGDDDDAVSEGGGQTTLGAIVAAQVQDRALFALPYSDIDIDALAHTTNGSKLWDIAQAQSSQTLNRQLGEELAANVRTDLLWPLDPASPQTVNFASAIGDGMTILSDWETGWTDTVPTAAIGSTPRDVTLAAGTQTIPGMVSDAGLIEALTVGPSPKLAEAQYFLADLALAGASSQMSDSAGAILAVLPRDWEPTSTIQDELDLIASLPWMAATRLSTAIDHRGGPTVTVQDLPAPTRGPSARSMTSLTGLPDRLAAFSEVLLSPPAFLATHSPSLIAPLAGHLDDPAEREALAQTAIDKALDALDSITVVAGSEMNLISEQGQVPIVVRNDFSAPVTVWVQLVPESSWVKTGEPEPLLVEPDSTGKALMPISAILNGKVDVDVILTNPDGKQIAETSTFRVQVRAEWESIGTAIIAVVIGLAFVIGLIRAIRRRRRRQGELPPTPAGGIGAVDEDAPKAEV